MSLQSPMSNMSRIHAIPIVVVKDQAAKDSASPAGAVVLALLSEIEAKLETFMADGQDSAIDLRWLRGMPRELDLLRKILGQGEVAATVAAAGQSQAQETAIPCVWWISHRDIDGRTSAEFVEITEIPELLRSDRLAIQPGLAELRARRALLDTPHPFSSI